MTSLFSKQTLANSLFKWEELAGKELLIRVGSVPDEITNIIEALEFDLGEEE